MLWNRFQKLLLKEKDSPSKENLIEIEVSVKNIAILKDNKKRETF